MTPKDYDTTLARIAGNIAGHLIDQSSITLDVEDIARTSVRLANEIVRLCKLQPARKPDEQ